MQTILNTMSVGNFWGLVGFALIITVLAANCSYQKRRTVARERAVVPKATATPQAKDARGGVVAHA
jgi:hypothetical protein